MKLITDEGFTIELDSIGLNLNNLVFTGTFEDSGKITIGVSKIEEGYKSAILYADLSETDPLYKDVGVAPTVLEAIENAFAPGEF